MQTSTAAVIRTMRLALEYGGKSHPIHKMPFVLGRARECDLVLFGDAVSRRHAGLVEHQGEVVVEDLGSRNGLLVNARRVRGRVRVQSGDTLMLGNRSVIVTPSHGHHASSRTASQDAGGACTLPARVDGPTRIV